MLGNHGLLGHEAWREALLKQRQRVAWNQELLSFVLNPPDLSRCPGEQVLSLSRENLMKTPRIITAGGAGMSLSVSLCLFLHDLASGSLWKDSAMILKDGYTQEQMLEDIKAGRDIVCQIKPEAMQLMRLRFCVFKFMQICCKGPEEQFPGWMECRNDVHYLVGGELNMWAKTVSLENAAALFPPHSQEPNPVNLNGRFLGL